MTVRLLWSSHGNHLEFFSTNEMIDSETGLGLQLSIRVPSENSKRGYELAMFTQAGRSSGWEKTSAGFFDSKDEAMHEAYEIAQAAFGSQCAD